MSNERPWEDMAEEKSQPANKHLEKRVAAVEKQTEKLAGVAADLDHRLDSIQAAASTSELILAIRDIAKAIREQTSSGASLITQAQLDKMAAGLDANTTGIINAETDSTKEGG